VALNAALKRLARRRSLSLCYHGLGESTAAMDPHFLMVHPDRFCRQVEMLRDAGFRFVTVAQLASSLPPAPGQVALSFDDGMEDNYSVLLPILREYGIPATIYVTTGLLGKRNPWVEADIRFMNEDELREVAAEGIEIGAHTVTHPDMATLSVEECLREVQQSKDVLEQIIKQPVTTFAYPFCSYAHEALEAVARADMAAAVTCNNRGGWTRFEMQRTMITGKDGVTSFALKALGAYEPLFHSPPGKALRVSTRAARAGVRALRERS
jgi:peptidoglycan/xylan/chitin deacetylase (PgdA/CDA1 family)